LKVAASYRIAQTELTEPHGEPSRPDGLPDWGPPPADRWWRKTVARWPVEWRERWGRRANELQDCGEPRDAAEWIAFSELAEAERRGKSCEPTRRLWTDG
jgi:hypothetical protein